MQDYTQSLLKDIGRSYVVSSLLPASMFVIFGVLIFNRLLPVNLWNSSTEKTSLFLGMITGLMIFATWYGFGLYSAQNFIIPLFEGYLFPKWLSDWLTNIKINQIKRKFGDSLDKFTKDYLDYCRLLQVYNSTTEITRDALESAKSVALLSFQNLQIIKRFVPINPNVCNPEKVESLVLEEADKDVDLIERSLVKPTDLGNNLFMGEYYPEQRYGFSLDIWQHLFGLLPENQVYELEEYNNKLIFLLNSSFSFILLAVISFVVSSFRMVLPLIKVFWEIVLMNYSFLKMSLLGILNNQPMVFFWQRNFNDLFALRDLKEFIIYLIITFFLLVLAFILYRMGVFAAEDFSRVVQATFDLYHLTLLEKFNLESPETLEEEKQIWEKVDLFFSAGDIFKVELPYKKKNKKLSKRKTRTKTKK